jgi:hypothetical protein
MNQSKFKEIRFLAKIGFLTFKEIRFFGRKNRISHIHTFVNINPIFYRNQKKSDFLEGKIGFLTFIPLLI